MRADITRILEVLTIDAEGGAPESTTPEDPERILLDLSGAAVAAAEVGIRPSLQWEAKRGRWRARAVVGRAAGDGPKRAADILRRAGWLVRTR
jgi:hypothetical protein